MADVVGDVRDAAARVANQQQILERHRMELMALVVREQDIQVATNLRPRLMLVPSAWELDPELVDGGKFWGIELLVAEVDEPLLAYGSA